MTHLPACGAPEALFTDWTPKCLSSLHRFLQPHLVKALVLCANLVLLCANIREPQLSAHRAFFFHLLKEASEEQQPRQSLGSGASHTHPCAGALVPALLWLSNAECGWEGGAAHFGSLPRSSRWELRGVALGEQRKLPVDSRLPRSCGRNHPADRAGSQMHAWLVRTEPSHGAVSCPLVSTRCSSLSVPVPVLQSCNSETVFLST